MPTSVEAVLVLIVVVSPGFIAVAIKNGFIPYRQPSAFQETVESVLLSTLLLPVWASFARPLFGARDAVVGAWSRGANVEVAAVAKAFVPVLIIYFVFAPLLGIGYGFLRRFRLQAAIANTTLTAGRVLWRKLGGRGSNEAPYLIGAGPEVWDDVIDSDLSNTPWVRVWFKDGSGLEGVLRRISTSPAPHQLYLTTLEGSPATLLRLAPDGSVAADLGAQGAQGVWIEVASDVRSIEFLQ